MVGMDRSDKNNKQTEECHLSILHGPSFLLSPCIVACSPSPMLSSLHNKRNPALRSGSIPPLTYKAVLSPFFCQLFFSSEGRSSLACVFCCAWPCPFSPLPLPLPFALHRSPTAMGHVVAYFELCYSFFVRLSLLLLFCAHWQTTSK